MKADKAKHLSAVFIENDGRDTLNPQSHGDVRVRVDVDFPDHGLPLIALFQCLYDRFLGMTGIVLWGIEID